MSGDRPPPRPWSQARRRALPRAGHALASLLASCLSPSCLCSPAGDTQGMLARPLSDPQGYPCLFLPSLPGKSGERRLSCPLSPWLPSHSWNQILSSLGSRTLRGTFTCLVPTQVLRSVTELQSFSWAPVVPLNKLHLWLKSLRLSDSPVVSRVSDAGAKGSWQSPSLSLSLSRGL